MPLEIRLRFSSYQGDARREERGGGGGASTFGVRGGPRDDAPHQAAVEQHFLGEAIVPAEMLQVFPPLGSLGRSTHGCNFTSITKHNGTSTTKNKMQVVSHGAGKL